jgi:preprotein translocase subunit SecA
MKGHITLFTKSFGRGTDFKCTNKIVLANGGVHVIQAFFSEELSEEV